MPGYDYDQIPPTPRTRTQDNNSLTLYTKAQDHEPIFNVKFFCINHIIPSLPSTRKPNYKRSGIIERGRGRRGQETRKQKGKINKY
jgi:hypothetical protein